MLGMKPLYRCRSEPQIAVLVTRTMASRSLRICGSGTVSTETSCLPFQHVAFILLPLPRISEQKDAPDAGPGEYWRRSTAPPPSPRFASNVASPTPTAALGLHRAAARRPHPRPRDGARRAAPPKAACP